MAFPYAIRPTIKDDQTGLLKPHPVTVALREALADSAKLAAEGESSNSSKDPLHDRLFVELNTETRKGRLRFDDTVFEARLLDLPCIVESLKTTDKKMFYKTGDICQMLVCKAGGADRWSSSGASSGADNNSGAEDPVRTAARRAKKKVVTSEQAKKSRFQLLHGTIYCLNALFSLANTASGNRV